MKVTIERWTDEAEIPEITELLHAAYAELAAMGFQYVATRQDDPVTKKRLERGESFVARDDGGGGRIVGTINLCPPGISAHTPWYSRPGVAFFGQFGVLPRCQRGGVGSMLLDAVEARALQLGATELACDTAEGATHLIEMYGRRGFRFIEYADWEVTNYRSVILSKHIGAVTR